MCSSNGGLVQAIPTSEMLLMIKTRERFIAPGKLTIEREIGRIKKKRCELERKHRKKILRKEISLQKNMVWKTNRHRPRCLKKKKKIIARLFVFLSVKNSGVGDSLSRGSTTKMHMSSPNT